MFLKIYNLSILNHEEFKNLNKLISSEEIETTIKTSPPQKNPSSDGFPSKFYQTFKEDLKPILKHFQKTLKGQ